MSALRALCSGLKGVKDTKTGMWNQVVDKPDREGNWNEPSGTAMFTYLIRKAIDKGHISRADYMPVMRRSYDGLIQRAEPAPDGRLDIVDCSSIGIMNNYKAYVQSSLETNTWAGVISFILGTSIMEFR